MSTVRTCLTRGRQACPKDGRQVDERGVSGWMGKGLGGSATRSGGRRVGGGSARRMREGDWRIEAGIFASDYVLRRFPSKLACGRQPPSRGLGWRPMEKQAIRVSYDSMRGARGARQSAKQLFRGRRSPTFCRVCKAMATQELSLVLGVRHPSGQGSTIPRRTA